MKKENKKYITFVQFENNIPMVAWGKPFLDNDYNLYVAISDDIKKAHITDDINYFKAVKRSFNDITGYKITKFYI